mgnify:CR=1 FL=1
MFQLSLGFLVGVYIGTYYDCKPILANVHAFILKYTPEPKKEM